MKKQEKAKPYVCNICDGKFTLPKELKKHVEEDHEGKKKKLQKIVHEVKEQDHERKRKNTYQCTTCEAKFISKSSLFTHIASVHEGIKSHKCSFCDASFGQTGNLNKHIKNIHGKLKTHVEEAHEGKKRKLQKIVHEEKEHMCSICNTGFKSEPELSEHKSIVHEGKKHGCSICGANLSGKSSHRLHIRSVGVVQVCAEHGL